MPDWVGQGLSTRSPLRNVRDSSPYSSMKTYKPYTCKPEGKQGKRTPILRIDINSNQAQYLRLMESREVKGVNRAKTPLCLSLT